MLKTDTSVKHEILGLVCCNEYNGNVSVPNPNPEMVFKATVLLFVGLDFLTHFDFGKSKRTKHSTDIPTPYNIIKSFY